MIRQQPEQEENLPPADATGAIDQNRRLRSSGPLPRNLLRVLVVEGRAEQVVQQQEGSPPHLGPLIAILKFSFAEKSKTANREKEKG